MNTRIDAARAAARARLGGDAAAADALLCHALKKPRAWLYAHPEAALDAARRRAFERLLARAAAGEPAERVIGRTTFGALEFEVPPEVFMPRPETETLVELALEIADEIVPGGACESAAESAGLRVFEAGADNGAAGSAGLRVLEAGTGNGTAESAGLRVLEAGASNGAAESAGLRVLEAGASNGAAESAGLRVFEAGVGSGAVIVSLAHARPDFAACGVDISAAAVAAAARNARRAGVAGLRLAQGGWFDAPDGGRFDMIVCNPPYVAVGDPALAPGVARFDPARALFAGQDGLDCLRAVIGGARARLRPGGCLLVEHGAAQRAAVAALFAKANYARPRAVRDAAGHPRVFAGFAPGG